MKTKENKKSKAFFLSRTAIILLAANLIPIAGILLNLWTTGAAIRFYWCECTLLGVLVTISYAQPLIIFFSVLILLAGAMFAQSIAIGPEWPLFITFWTFYGLCWYGYVEIVRSPLGEAIRKLHPARQMLAFTVFTLSAAVVCAGLAIVFFGEWGIFERISFSQVVYFYTLMLAVPVISASILRVVGIVGPQQFLGLATGAYFQPIQNEQVVMILDMANSTEIAEGLEPLKSMDLISRLIFDVCAITRRQGGDILNFTGDGILAVWPIKNADLAVSTIEGIRTRLKKNTSLYRADFGMTPEFRIGVHAGKVVIGQIGEEKLFLGIHGDVVNTAARLEKLNKTLGTSALISSAVVQAMSAAKVKDLDDLGLKNLPGRHDPIHVFSVP